MMGEQHNLEEKSHYCQSILDGQCDAGVKKLKRRITALEAERDRLAIGLETLKRETMEVCICAAVKSDGEIYRGHRHSDCFNRMAACKTPRSGSIQGFITSRNRFVDRTEGRALQDAAGIPSAEKQAGYEPGTLLMSDDLY